MSVGPSTRERFSCRLYAVLTADHFPNADRLLRRLFWNPLGGLTLTFAVALLCGFYLHPHGFALAFGLLAVLFLGVVWPWVNLRFLQGTLSFGCRRAREGDLVQVRATVRNRLPWTTWGIAVKEGFTAVEPPASGLSHAASFAVIPGWKTIACDWEFVPLRRGVYPLSPPRLTSGFPFGLREARRSLAVEATLVVWPRTFPVADLPEPIGEHNLEGAVSRSKAGNTGDVLGVRPYRRGDSPRRVHWGQTARHDRLIVCELQSTARPVVQVLLDTDPAVHAGSGADSSREWAVRIAASLCEAWLEQGAEVETLIHGQFAPASAGSAHRRALLDTLARLPDAGDPVLADTLATTACRNFTDGLRVIVTTDRALARLPANWATTAETRFVVLHADAFAGAAPNPSLPLPVQPWFWVDDPRRVAAQMGRPRKEVGGGS
jgi:uncharacterized protein (DUF58 family)